MTEEIYNKATNLRSLIEKDKKALGSQRITFFELLLVKPRKLLIFAPLNGKIPCECGVIGSRARLRIWCREACRFESYHPHNPYNKFQKTNN